MKSYAANALRVFLSFLTPIRLLVITCVGAFFWFLILGDQGIYQLRMLLEMKQRLIHERGELNDEIDRLSAEKEMLKDPSKLEMVIRQELGYIRPGEVLFEEGD